MNVFEFVKKKENVLNHHLADLEFCDAGTVNQLLQTSGINVLVLNEEGNVIGRNWVV